MWCVYFVFYKIIYAYCAIMCWTANFLHQKNKKGEKTIYKINQKYIIYKNLKKRKR